MGFDAVIQGRMDNMEIDKRMEDQTMEYVHIPDGRSGSQIFTHTLPKKNYNSPYYTLMASIYKYKTDVS